MKKPNYASLLIIFVTGLFLIYILLTTVNADSKPAKKPLLSLDFNQDFKGGDGESPIRQKKVVFEKGIKGSSIKLETGSELAYSSDAKNFNKASGTLEFWFKPTTWGTDGQLVHRFFDVRFRCDAKGCLNYMVFDVNHDTKEMYFSINDCNCPWPSPNKESKISILPASNQWHHIAVTWDRAKGSKLYFNGKRVAENTQPFSLKDLLPDSDPMGGIMLANPEHTPIGTLKPGSLIDEFRIDSYSKSDEEIAADYEKFRKDQPLAIDIDAGKAAGELPHLYRASVWLSKLWDSLSPSSKYITSKLFAENQMGEIQMGSIGALTWSADFEEYKERLPNEIPGYLAELIKVSGQKVLVGNFPFPMPEWLSSRAGDQRPYSGTGFTISKHSPPKCYGYKCTKMEEITCYTQRCKDITQEQLEKDGFVYGWASGVDYLLRYFYETLGVKNVGYYVGHEQNKDWMGTEEEFYKTYEYTVKAAKNISPAIAVGGSGAWGWNAKRLPCDPVHYSSAGLEICTATKGWAIDGEHCKDVKQSNDDPSCESMNENLLQYAKARGLPIDFLNYHMFGEPATFGYHKENADAMKQWLKENGFSENTPLYPADWTVWGNTYPADYLDTSYVSPYIIGSLLHMARAGIQWHGHDFDVSDERIEKRIIKQRGKDAQFIGDWAIFTRDKVIKPAYNAFTALSIFAGKREAQIPSQLEISAADDYFVTTAASQTKDKRTTRVLLSNFVPSAEVAGARAHLPYLGPVLKSCMLSKGYSEEEYKSIGTSLKTAVKQNPPKGGMTLEYVIRLIQDTIPDPKTRDDLLSCVKNDVLEMKRDIDRYAKEPRDVNLVISGLAAGSYRIKKYLIDKEHSNSCSYNKRTETSPSKTPCGINGEIDRKVAAAKKEAQSKGKEDAFKYLKEEGYTDKDISLIIQTVKSCKMSVKCVQTQIINNYNQLERCKTKGVYDPRKCPSSEIVISEFKAALDTFKSSRDKVLYYDSANSIGKINNLKEVALEMVESRQITIDKNYEESITMHPSSVLLVEITRIS